MELLVAHPEYYRSQIKPRNFQAWCDMYEAHNGPLGLWELASIYKGEVVRRVWMKNVVTDSGAKALLQRMWNASSATLPPIFNQIAITTNGGSTVLTSTITLSNTYSTLSVANLPAPLAANTVLTLGFGTGTTQNVTLSTSASISASTLNVNVFTASATFVPGSNVVPQPNVTDNPITLSGTIAYSGPLPTTAFTYSGSGAGNRQVQVQYLFDVTTTAGNYTESWLVNNVPPSTDQTSTHIIFPAEVVSPSTAFQITLIEKL